jgi:hypothetical protein
MNNNDAKYPISKHSKQCIGPCYEADKPVVHPFTLEYIVMDKPFCPVAAFEGINKKTGKEQFYYSDECYITKNNNADFYGNKSNILVPEIEFSCAQFLTLYYKINNFDDALTWVTNNKAPIYSKLRIINCALKIYSSQFEIIEDRLVAFYVDVVKKLWLVDIYRVVDRFINIEGSNINFKIDLNTMEILKRYNNIADLCDNIDFDEDPFYKEKHNFLAGKFANKNIVYKFLTKYVLGREYDDNLKLGFLKYILSKMALI